MTSQPDRRKLKIHLRFGGSSKPQAQAVVRLRIEDASMADRKSDVLVEEAVPLQPGEDYTIEVPAGLIDGRASYSLFVHVDANGSGKIESGDFISPEVNSVLTHGAQDSVNVRLVPVGR
jgi:uncharacterized lipoprotein YbaY